MRQYEITSATVLILSFSDGGQSGHASGVIAGVVVRGFRRLNEHHQTDASSCSWAALIGGFEFSFKFEFVSSLLEAGGGDRVRARVCSGECKVLGGPG